MKKDFPGFLFECIPAKDIRTKKAREAAPEIQGLLDSGYKVRSSLKEKTEHLIDLLNNHLR